MKKEIIEIKGMHCRSCEVLLETELLKVASVKKVNASTKKNQVELSYTDQLNIDEVVETIDNLGYAVGKNSLPVVSKNTEDYKLLISAVLFVVAFYLFAKAFNFEQLLNISSTNNATLPVVFAIGITAGFSTCMAIVGGLVLGISTRFAEKHPNSSPTKKFTPHLYFNLGRILSYTILGGLIGLLGSALKLPTSAIGLLSVVVGIYMLFIGLQITNMFPRLNVISFMPKFFSKKILKDNDSEYNHLNTALLGASTFFLPCGFTQAMQVYAVTTGSFVSGALIMGVFALGTTPGLLGIGGLVSYLKKGYLSKLFFKLIGVVIIVLSFYNISNGFNLAGINLSLPEKTTTKDESDSKPAAGVQLIKATYSADKFDLTPNKLTVKAGSPVRFEVYAEDDGTGCMGSIMIPGLASEPQFYKKGEVVVFQFTPKKPGKYRVTCAMGIPSAEIIVE